MFAPQDFLPVSKFLSSPPKEAISFGDQLIPPASEWLQMDSMLGQIDDEPKEREWQLGFQAYRFFRASFDDIVESYIFDAIEDWLHLAKPGDNQPIRLDLRPMLSPNGEQECCLYDLYMHGPEFPPEYIERYRLFDLNIADVVKEWIHLPVEEGAYPSIAEFVDREYRYGIGGGHLQLPWWYERQCGTVDLSVFDLIADTCPKHTDFRPFAKTANVLRAFEGYAICVPTEFLEQGWPNADSVLPWTKNQSTALGRPRKLDDALVAYDRIFPGGHPGTWKEASKEIWERERVNIAPSTLSKGVRERRKAKQAQQKRA